MKELHTPEEDQLEKKSQNIFIHAMLWTGVALVIILLAALAILWRPGRHIRAASPDPHPTSLNIFPGLLVTPLPPDRSTSLS